jgi:hypothetical protein
MALETRLIPVLKGRVAKEFFERLKTCTVSQSREEVRISNRQIREMVVEERSRERNKKYI